MKNHWKMAVWLAGFALVTAAPFLVKADGSNFGVKIGDDNEAHYRFRDRRVRHDPQMLQAARLLAAAKERLWYLRDGFNGHRSAAVASI
ncbi:MAG TPA: hypothetical protein VFR02_09705, partial [bacterium]|nr:hypothetical protein [bacterium]